MKKIVWRCIIMKYTAETKPGMADPYWYEWSVGQRYLVDMLNPDSHIQYVELQANVQLGLDDVVITYDDGKTRFIQVKHTRADDTITFGDLVSIDKSKKDTESQFSLLRELARSWNYEKSQYVDSEIFIFTNRKAGNRTSSAGIDGNIKRPPLGKFLLELRNQVGKVQEFSDLAFPQYEKAWKEWCNQLKDIDNDEDKLIFLKNLHIETEQEDLKNLGDSIKKKLQIYLGVSEEISDVLLGKLDHALREWTISKRKSSKITIEKLYSALSVKEDLINYNHDLIPVNPFFHSRQELVAQIESDLLDGDERILFVSGVPGTGKTNVISKLCSKKDSIVDIRYYAYEPIDPAKEYLPADVSKRVKKEVFWDTLLNQVRELLTGSLYKYKVPVSNSFLKLEEKKKEFFRIASEFAKDRNRVFILAVDGLDHAARAGMVEDTFLPTLPNPEYIPSNVKIILAGQPKEDYRNYPDWLYADSNQIKEYQIPNIQPSDIKELVNERCTEYSSSNREIVTNIICKYAGGNTLAAIFAVHEALNCQDPTLLEDKLKSRKLSGNIQEYYRTIWEDTKKKMQIPFVDYKIAGVFAFFNEPINGEKLSLIFKDEGISSSSWNNVLKALSPLLIKRNGVYTILHNDVRVYLSSIIGRDQECVREVYSSLADYYLAQNEKSIGYYRDVIRFLVSSGRIQEFSMVYTPEYVLNSYVKGIELTELSHITDELMRFIINEDCFDWNKFLSLVLGYLTIEQIKKTSYEIEDLSFRSSVKMINIHPYECYIVPSDKWNSRILSKVFRLIDDLFENGEEYRGKMLFLNWFSDTKFSEIQKIINDETDDHGFGVDRDIAKLLSKACVNSEHFEIFQNVLELKDNRFLIDAVENIESQVIEKFHANKLEKALDSLEILLIDPIVCGIKKLFEQNRYKDLEIIKESIQKRKTTNSMSKLILIFLKIVTGSIDWNDDQSEFIWREMESVKMPNSISENLMSYYTIYAIVAAYIQKKSRSEVAREITNKYIETHSHQKSKYFLLYFNAVTYLAKWIKAKNEKKYFYESKEDLKFIIENLFCKYWNPNERDFETLHLRAHLLKAFIILSEKENDQFQNAIKESFEKVFAKNPVNQLLDPGMLYYRNNPERMQEWIDEWLKDNGKVWSEQISDRNSIIKKFTEVKNKYDKNNELNLHNAVDKVQWSVIGFSSHKEYCVDYLLNWYNNLVDKSPEFISKYGTIVKEISDKIELLGDNRMEYVLNSKIYSDWGSEGDVRISNILQDRRLFAQCIIQPIYMADILIGYLKERKCERTQLLSIWAIGIGLLDWRNEDNHDAISALQRSIEISALKNGINDIKNDLEKLGPAYIDLTVDSGKYISPDRWFDKENISEEELEKAREVLTEYLTNSEDHQQSNEVKVAIKILYLANKLEQTQVKQVLSVELRKDNYGINQNSILEFIFGIANSDDVDNFIRLYISTAMDNNRFYPNHDLPAIIGWRLKYKDEEYNDKCLNQLIKTFRCWITASDHITAPELEEGYDYSPYIEFEKEDLIGNFLEIMLLIIISDDADAARVSLGGVSALLQIDINYISKVEKYWKKLHYRAKEWILMIYEFVYNRCPEYHEKIYEYLLIHSKDEDFNVALYSKLLCENINPEYANGYGVEKKRFFSSIPKKGNKLLIKTPRNSSCINGYECVLEQKKLLEERLQKDLIDIERRTAEYSECISISLSLLPLFRNKSGGCKVICDKVNLAFFRVLYSDWYDGRWDGVEAEVARVILSASEPYTLLVSPSRWKWNKGKLYDDPKNLMVLTEQERNSRIEELLSTGLNCNEKVIAGVIEDYTYNNRFFGYLLGYLDVPGMNEQYVLPSVERNARLFLKKRNDYREYQSPNVTMHQNGIESFKQSNIMCGFGHYILLAFGWRARFSSDGLVLVNNNDKIVGRLECFYGFRVDIGNRVPSNQPYVQRWIVQKDLLQNALESSRCPYQVKIAIGSIITESMN